MSEWAVVREFRSEAEAALAVADASGDNVFVSQRGSSIRFAPHLHVTEDDIGQLFGALAKTGIA